MRAINAVDLLDMRPGVQIAAYLDGGAWAANVDTVRDNPDGVVWEAVADVVDDDTHVIVTVDSGQVAIAKTAELVAWDRLPVDQYRILADVQARKVTMGGDDMYHPPADVDTDLLGEYRTQLHVMRAALVWVMDSGKRTPEGDRVLCLTTIGEHMLRAANPDRYRSTTSIEQRDGQYRSEAVTRR